MPKAEHTPGGPKECKKCAGSGIHPMNPERECPDCGGDGREAGPLPHEESNA